MPEQLITYILDNGGIWGLLLILSIFVNIFLATNPKLFRGKDKKEKPAAPPSGKTEQQKEQEFDLLAKKIEKMSSKIDVLAELHNVKDEDGVPVWYLKRSVIDTISEIKTNTYKIIEVTNKLVEKQQTIVGDYDGFVENYTDLVKEYHATLQDLILGLERLKVQVAQKD